MNERNAKPGEVIEGVLLEVLKNSNDPDGAILVIETASGETEHVVLTGAQVRCMNWDDQ